MKDTFVHLSEYIESLEQRIAALETRAAALESRALDADLRRKETEDQLTKVMAQLAASAARIAALETQPVQPVADATPQTVEPEVDVELVVEDQENEVIESQADETPQIEEPAQVEEPAPVEEPVKDESKAEPMVAPKPEKPAAVMPQQTSLFGAPVADIRQAISLGDRFLFQRELFAGNGETMQKMLDRLNAAANWGEAIDIVGQQDWNKESSTYELFLNVLRRRFSDTM